MASKDAYLRRIEAELAEWNERASRATRPEGPARRQAAAADGHWSAAVREARARLEDARDASGEEFLGAKDRLDRAMLRLRELGGAVIAPR